MCVMIYHGPHAAPLREDELFLGYAGNPHSMGLMWSTRGEVRTWKSTRDELNVLLDRVRQLETQRVPFAVHFRYATHGAIDVDNAHPIAVFPGQLELMHNGILNGRFGQNRSVSDTRMLAETLLRQLPTGWVRNDAVLELLAHTIGPHNKLILMTPKETVIVNRKSGSWHRGSWWSNRDDMNLKPLLGETYVQQRA